MTYEVMRKFQMLAEKYDDLTFAELVMNVLMVGRMHKCDTGLYHVPDEAALEMMNRLDAEGPKRPY